MIQPAAPAWTLKGKKYTIDKLNDGHIDSSPGPMYNLHHKGIKTRSVAFKTGNSQRIENNPSPSQYNPNHPALLTHSVSFPKQQKFRNTQTQINPDPSAYKFNPNVIKQKYPNYSLGSRYPSIMDDTGNNPGPGYYNNPEVTLETTRTKNSKFGTQSRFSQPNVRMPGPGDYELAQDIYKAKLALSKSSKFLTSNNGKPGPGEYQTFQQFNLNIKKNKGKTLGKKLDGCFNTDSNTVESFSNYFRDGQKIIVRTYSVGKQKRQVFNGNSNPGPLDYKPKTAYTTKNSANAKFTQSTFVQKNQVAQFPGPGTYKDQQFDSTKYTIPKSKSMNSFNKNPGVGRYSTLDGMGTIYYKYKNQQTGNLIGKSQRTNFVSKNMAGVGDYYILSAKTGGVSIPKASRFPKPNNNPGPGDYNMHSTISNFNFYRKKL